jgi:hypothetical protein
MRRTVVVVLLVDERMGSSVCCRLDSEQWQSGQHQACQTHDVWQPYTMSLDSKSE